MFSKAYSFLKLSRATFLFGGVVMYGLGAAIAYHQGYDINLKWLLWGQVIVTSTQVMTHFCNEYFDYESDKLNLTPTYWSGGSRVLPDGELPVITALYAAVVCAFVALTLSFILAFRLGDFLLLIILLLIILLSWGYSAPPLRLHSRSLGELTSTLIVALGTPFVAFYLQTGTASWLLLGAVVPLLCLQFNMLLSVHLPDVEGDRQSDKITLVVRYGRQTTSHIYSSILIGMYVCLPLLIGLGLPKSVGLSVFIGLPLALWLLWRMTRRDWENPGRWGWLAFFSIALLMITALLETTFFVLAA